MLANIILCSIVGSLLMIMLSAYRESHRKKNYPSTVLVDGEIISVDGKNPQTVHLVIKLEDEETGGKTDE